MGYWGWRPLVLLLFISVLITACTDTQENAPAVPPTLPPAITITIRGPDVNQAATAPWLSSSTTIPHLEIISTEDSESVGMLPVALQPTPTPLLLSYELPACYPMLDGNILCLGSIINPSDDGVERMMIQAVLVSSGGDVLQSQVQAVGQRYMLPGGVAPYWVIFASLEGEWLPDVFGAVQVNLLRAEAVPTDEIYALRVEDQQSELVEGRYQMSAALHNDTSFDVVGVQVVGMAQDDAGHIAGYRMMEIACVPAGERVRVSFDMVLNFNDLPLNDVLFALGEQSAEACY